MFHAACKFSFHCWGARDFLIQFFHRKWIFSPIVEIVEFSFCHIVCQTKAPECRENEVSIVKMFNCIYTFQWVAKISIVDFPPSNLSCFHVLKISHCVILAEKKEKMHEHIKNSKFHQNSLHATAFFIISSRINFHVKTSTIIWISKLLNNPIYCTKLPIITIKRSSQIH